MESPRFRQEIMQLQRHTPRRALGLSAKVVMPKTANPFRVERCNMLGAEVVFAEGMDGLVAAVETLQREEGRAMIHPFEGPHTVAGTGTVGLEFMADVASPLDAVIVPIGGGGLIAGIGLGGETA